MENTDCVYVVDCCGTDYKCVNPSKTIKECSPNGICGGITHAAPLDETCECSESRCEAKENPEILREEILITTKYVKVAQNEKKVIRYGVHNPLGENLEVKPDYSCNGNNNFTFDTEPFTLEAGASKLRIVAFSSSNTLPGTYACQIVIDITERIIAKDITIEVFARG